MNHYQNVIVIFVFQGGKEVNTNKLRIQAVLKNSTALTIINLHSVHLYLLKIKDIFKKSRTGNTIFLVLLVWCFIFEAIFMFCIPLGIIKINEAIQVDCFFNKINSLVGS